MFFAIVFGLICTSGEDWFFSHHQRGYPDSNGRGRHGNMADPADPTVEVNPPKGVLYSDFVASGKEPMSDLIKQIYSDFNERNGTNVELP